MNFWELDMSLRSAITVGVLIVLCLVVFAVLFMIDRIRQNRYKKAKKRARARECARAKFNRQVTFVNCLMDEFL